VTAKRKLIWRPDIKPKTATTGHPDLVGNTGLNKGVLKWSPADRYYNEKNANKAGKKEIVSM
jgi:hypothetical protein